MGDQPPSPDFTLGRTTVGLGALRRSQTAAAPRLVLLPGCLDRDGELRVAVLPAGPGGVPVAYASIGAALAALRQQEAATRAPAPR
jgi:hypothetical protein